jgi:hypothetical protein
MMAYSARFSTKLVCVALVCIGAILLAWAAPVIISSGDMPEAMLRGQGQPAADPADAPTELEDASDDPVVLAASSQPGNLPVAYTLHTDSLLDRAWSPTALVRPPNFLNFI